MKNAGFTLVELIVVAAIIGLISGITMVSWRSAQDSLALDRATQRIAQDIRGTLNWAVSARTYNANNECASGDPIKPGYGIYFEGNSSVYWRYVDCNGNYEWDGNPPDEKMPNITAPEGTLIQSVTPSPLHLFFESPDPKVYIDGDTIPGAQGEIVVKLGDHERIITITTRGVIEIQ
ncbi:MAG: type II secretion system protein [Patescibacteria group bacterium]|mgnify:CR=1 FL=1